MLTLCRLKMNKHQRTLHNFIILPSVHQSSQFHSTQQPQPPNPPKSKPPHLPPSEMHLPQSLRTATQAIKLSMHANTRSLHLLGGLLLLTVIIMLICTFLLSWKHGGGDNGKQSIEEEIKSVLGGRLRSLPTGVPGVGRWALGVGGRRGVVK